MRNGNGREEWICERECGMGMRVGMWDRNGNSGMLRLTENGNGEGARRRLMTEVFCTAL